MAAKLRQYAQTLYNHKKKSIFAVVVGYYGVSWLRESNRDARIRSFYAKAAKRYGDLPISPEDRPRRVTVLINPNANSGKASDNFTKNALPLLNLSGLDVTVIKAKDAEELESLAAVLEPTEADAIYVVGGDGTLSRVLTGLFGPKSLNRSGKALPVGVFPGGVENRAIFGLLPDLFASTSDVAKFCECAMAVIEEQKRAVYPVQCQISTTTDDGENTSEQLVTLDNIAAGWFEHCEHKKQKFWYYGGLKTRFTYLFEMLKNTPTPLQLDVDYEEYCSGCNRCKTATARNSAPAVERQYAKDYSNIVNPKCGTRHKAHVQATDVQIRNLQVQDGSQLKLEAGGSNLGRLGVISEGWSRRNKPNREPSTPEFYDSHLVARAMNILFDKKEGESGSDDDKPTQTVAIGGERKKLKAGDSVLRIEPVQRPLHMFLPTAIRVNLESI
ncbi:Protein F52C9.3 [Aphelenchoides avenae]|nr:Protein F52C9.3 [Aphelenchus avenae]